MYGTQTALLKVLHTEGFENDVKMYGTQTNTKHIIKIRTFENDVKMYGTQTKEIIPQNDISLRMM